MADTVLNQEGTTALFAGDRKVITHYNNVSDSTGATTKILDVSDYTNAAGSTAATASLNKIWYSVSVTAKVDALRVAWDADTDAVFLTLEGDGFFDYVSSPQITVIPQNGKIIFTKVEPFGRYLFDVLDDDNNSNNNAVPSLEKYS